MVNCCFCNEDIVSNHLDPCDISILSNWDKERGTQRDQVFWCHFNCLKKSFHTEVRTYLFLDVLSYEDENEEDSK